MNWKTAFRSFYYENAQEPDDIKLDPKTTALLVIDIQNTYLEKSDDEVEAVRWAPFLERMNSLVIPNTAMLIDWARGSGLEVMFARIACETENGRDRSLSQKTPSSNYLMMPKSQQDSKLLALSCPRVMKL